jgi:hypothetical protein
MKIDSVRKGIILVSIGALLIAVGGGLLFGIEAFLILSGLFAIIFGLVFAVSSLPDV